MENAQFVYSFLVAVLLFGIAGWKSLKHGYEAIMHPEPVHVIPVTLPVVGGEIPSVWVNYVVLIAAILFESYAFLKANASLTGQIERRDWSGYREAFRKTANVTVLMAFTEDAIALSGAAIALVGIYLTRVTENPIYDAVAATLIGVLLMGFALALARENKRLLLGESVPEDEEADLRRIVSDWEGVVHVDDFRTVYFGPHQLLVTADVSFETDLDTGEIDRHITDIKERLREVEDSISKVYIEPET